MLRRRENWLGLAVGIFATLVYLNTINHGYVLDDYSVIKDNYIVKKGLAGVKEIFQTHYRFGYGYVQANLYRPLTLSVFAFQWELFPDFPPFAHFFNIVLYGLCAWLLFRFLKLLFGKDHLPVAFVCALLFAAHPIHTEVVANIKSLDDILSLIFCLSTAQWYLKSVDHHSKKSLIYANIFFFLALLSKESAVVFLGVIPLAIWLFRDINPQRIARLSLWMLLPFALFGVMRIMVLGSFSGDKAIAKIDNLLMAAPNEIIKIATAFKILGLYLWKLIFPHPLMNDYSWHQISLSSFQDWRVWASILIYSTLIYLFLHFRKKQAILSFGIGWYLMSVSLYSNLFFTIGTSFGERLMFIPSIGFVLCLSWILFKLSKIPFNAKRIKPTLTFYAPLILVLSLYAFKTIDRNAAWKDNFTLYSTDVKHCDQSARCQYYYGLGLMKERAMQTEKQAQKRAFLAESVNAFSKALEILPTYSDAYGQRGLAYYRLKNYRDALENYDKAIQFNPQNSTAFSNKGTLLFEMGEYQKAKFSFEQALKFQPNFVDALANYASTLGTLGDFQGSITYFQKAIKLRPQEAKYYQMIGISYQNMGKTGQANYFFKQAQAIQNQK